MHFQSWHAVLFCALAGAPAGCGDGDGGAAPQPPTGTVRGAVLQSSGAGMAGVVVRLGRLAEPAHQTSTGADGGFSFLNVEAGHWNLLYLLPGGYATAGGESNYRTVSVAPNEQVVVAPFVIEPIQPAPGPAVQLVEVWGNGQLGVPGDRLYYLVEARDAYGNAVYGGTIDWRVESGGGRIVPISSNPRYGEHVLGPLIGFQTVTATARSIVGSPEVKFTTAAVDMAVSVVGGYDYYYGDIAPAFLPATIEVATGQTAGWRWATTIKHNVVFEDDPSFTSPDQSSGVHLRKFDNAGTVRYRCTLHSKSFNEGMVGTVKVVATGG